MPVFQVQLHMALYYPKYANTINPVYNIIKTLYALKITFLSLQFYGTEQTTQIRIYSTDNLHGCDL